VAPKSLPASQPVRHPAMLAPQPTRTVLDRLRAAERGLGLRFAWAILGSAWVHIGIAGVVLVGSRCMPVDDATQTADQPMAVLLVEPPQPREHADEAPPPARDGSHGTTPQGGTGDTSLDGASWAALDARALTDLDPEALRAADPELLDALPPEALAELDPEVLVELDPSLLEELLVALPPADARRLAIQDSLARRLPSGLAAPPDQRAADPLPAPGDPTPVPSDEAPGHDPDAVADTALDERPDPERVEQDPKERDEQEEEAEDLEEPEPEPEQDPRWQRYLHAEETAPVEDPLDGDYISSRNSRAEELRKVEVTSEIEGVATPPLDGLPIEAGTPSLDLADGDPDALGGDAPAAGEPVEQRISVQQGGGDDGDAPGQGSPMVGEGLRGGAPSRSGRRAAASASAALVTGSEAPVDGVPEAPNPDALQPLRQDAWWSPKVARILVQAPEVEPAEAPITAALANEQVDEAPEPRPDEEDDRGGTEQPVEVDEPLPESPEETSATEEGEVEPLEEPEPVQEPIESVADLRQSLGWGGDDDTRSRPKRSMPGIAVTDGNLRTSKQTASTELMLDRFASVDAKDSPLGRYRAQLDEEVRKQWHTMDLSLHERALGIQGDVTVAFQIQHNGKVTEKTITRSSGHASLDAMALDAIPEKLPRFPKDIEGSSLFHSYTFVYRNPIIVEGDASPKE